MTDDNGPVAVPVSFLVMDAARAWGIPPWAVAGSDEPTDDERRRWFVRSMIRSRLGV